MAKEWLKECHAFVGRVTIGGGWIRAPIILKPNLNLHIFLPGFYTVGRDGDRPKAIEGRIEDWNIKVVDGAISLSFIQGGFDPLNELTLKSTEEEAIRLFLNEHREKICTEITYTPKTILFERSIFPADLPEEWGLTLYPPRNNNTLFHFFKDNLNPRGLPRRFSNIFDTADTSLYFRNFEQWSLDSLRKRLRLLTDVLSFFTGAPVTYELVVGRSKKEILCIQIHNISKPNAYLCPSLYNSRIEIKENSLLNFPPSFVRKIEELFNENDHERVTTLLSYFRMLYMAPYDEAKIALSFQVMESLAKYKRMKFKGLATFDEYIGKALDALRIEESVDVSPEDIRQIATTYRNKVFHGNFFETMHEIDHLVNVLPEGYRRDLPIILQAIAEMIGVHFILGIDFSQMIALRRTND